MKFQVFDYNYDEKTKTGRMAEFVDVLRHMGLQGAGNVQVWDENGKLVEIEKDTDVVFLHLGTHRSGNARSVEFYRKKLMDRQIGLIAYTGGEQAALAGFKHSKWHTYEIRVSSPDVLNLSKFFKAWQQARAAQHGAPPPFHLLRNWSPLPQAFEVLRVGFLATYGEKGLSNIQDLPQKLRNSVHQMKEKQKLVTSREWWEPVLGKDCKGQELSARVKRGDRETMVRGLVKLFQRPHRPPSGNDLLKVLRKGEP